MKRLRKRIAKIETTERRLEADPTCNLQAEQRQALERKPELMSFLKDLEEIMEGVNIQYKKDQEANRRAFDNHVREHVLELECIRKQHEESSGASLMQLVRLSYVLQQLEDPNVVPKWPFFDLQARLLQFSKHLFDVAEPTSITPDKRRQQELHTIVKNLTEASLDRVGEDGGLTFKMIYDDVEQFINTSDLLAKSVGNDSLTITNISSLKSTLQSAIASTIVEASLVQPSDINHNLVSSETGTRSAGPMVTAAVSTEQGSPSSQAEDSMNYSYDAQDRHAPAPTTLQPLTKHAMDMSHSSQSTSLVHPTPITENFQSENSPYSRFSSMVMPLPPGSPSATHQAASVLPVPSIVQSMQLHPQHAPPSYHQRQDLCLPVASLSGAMVVSHVPAEREPQTSQKIQEQQQHAWSQGHIPIDLCAFASHGSTQDLASARGNDEAKPGSSRDEGYHVNMEPNNLDLQQGGGARYFKEQGRPRANTESPLPTPSADLSDSSYRLPVNQPQRIPVTTSSSALQGQGEGRTGLTGIEQEWRDKGDEKSRPVDSKTVGSIISADRGVSPGENLSHSQRNRKKFRKQAQVDKVQDVHQQLQIGPGQDGRRAPSAATNLRPPIYNQNLGQEQWRPMSGLGQSAQAPHFVQAMIPMKAFEPQQYQHPQMHQQFYQYPHYYYPGYQAAFEGPLTREFTPGDAGMATARDLQQHHQRSSIQQPRTLTPVQEQDEHAEGDVDNSGKTGSGGLKRA
ncbi:hypothetical protein BGZ98_007758 [Dissophora globulifera]|nr:hypothetical protein BGZ98_007758 [Dissophora globulifera]